MVRDTKKVIHILQLKLLIRFAQAIVNSSKKEVIQTWKYLVHYCRAFKKSGPKYPNSWERTQRKCNVFSLIFYIKRRLTKVVSRSSEGHLLWLWTQIPQIKVRESYIERHCRCLTFDASVFENWGKSRKNPNKGHGYTEIHPYC